MLKKVSLFISILLAFALCLPLITGCSSQLPPESSEDLLSETGCIVLKVNPEISIHYNKEGKVEKLEGDNDDGTIVVDAYKDYIGKDARDVATDLIGVINSRGYFVSDIDDSHRNITIQIEPGSVLPQEDFIETLVDDIQAEVKALDLSSQAVGGAPSDYRPDRSTATVNRKLIPDQAM